MALHLKILPPAQQQLWPMLKDIPKNFILYGGTAIALQLGHRISVDFDFFSDEPLNREQLLVVFPILEEHPLVQSSMNTIDSIIELAEGSVKLQFLAGLGARQKRLFPPIIASDNQLQIASLRDLFATKLNTVQHRAECKDYIDIDALICSGLTLEQGLADAVAVFGKRFDVATSLRALCSYRDGDLPELDEHIKARLKKHAISVENISKD